MDSHIALAERGHAVLPIVAGGKKPLTRHGVLEASSDLQTVERWARQYPGCNWAWAMGGPLHLVGVDADKHGKVDGVAAYHELVRDDYGEPITQTPNGEHHVYSAPYTVGNGVSRLAPGVDHRGDGGYILIPSSETAAGRYGWLRSALDTDIPSLPENLLERLQTPLDWQVGQDWTPTATVDGTIARLAAAEIGTRNDTLNLCAYILGRLITAGQVDEQTARVLLSETADSIGLGVRETDRTITSGLAAGMAATGCLPVAAARINALAWLQRALGTPWPGRTGSTDRRVFVGHISVAVQTGGTWHGVDCRTLAELGNTTQMTAWRATERLIAQNLLVKVNVGGKVLRDAVGQVKGTAATVYALPDLSNNVTFNHVGDTDRTESGATTAVNVQIEAQSAGAPTAAAISTTSAADRASETSSHMVECNVIAQIAQRVLRHDAFSWSGMGSAAGEVYASLLASGPATVAELAERTGRSRATVYYVLTGRPGKDGRPDKPGLSRLVDEITGEIFSPLVFADGKRWVGVDVDLDALAEFLHVAGRGERRHERHEHERQTFAELCQKNTAKEQLREARQAVGKRRRWTDAERQRFNHLWQVVFGAPRQAHQAKRE